MPDDLRTRIAAALKAEPSVVLSASAAQVLADAVIRELVRYWDKDFKELHYCRECGGWGPMNA